MTFRSPEVLAEPSAIVAYQRIGGVQYIAVRAVVLLQLDDLRDAEVALKLLHIAGIGATKRVNALIVIAHREYRGLLAGKQSQPFVLQAAGILKLIHENMAKAASIMLAHDLVAIQQFVIAQQQFSKVDHALLIALLLVDKVKLHHFPREIIVRFNL